MRTQKSISSCLLAALWLFSASSVGAIENDPKKDYPLNEKYGPWMVMVATFSDVHDERQKTKGLSAEEAADKLVHELRGKGIPAYSYAQDGRKEKIETFDRLGNKDERVYTAQHGMVCVLAGNYPKIDDPVAQKTLTFIKRFRPKFMSDTKSGAIARNPADPRKGPFSGAFLTINPLLKPSDVVRHKVDSETLHFNSGIDYPLIGLKRKYSLKIATFNGKSVVPLGSSRYAGHEENFDKALASSGAHSLARAGEDATQLTYALRQNSAANKSLGRDHFEAYVFHDKFQSYVTVGGFDSENDPEIKKLAEIFAAKYKPDQNTGEYSLLGESLSLPGATPKDLPIHTWAFDPAPQLIEVPRLR